MENVTYSRGLCQQFEINLPLTLNRDSKNNSKIPGIFAVPVSTEEIIQIILHRPGEHEPDPSCGDEVVRGPVGGPDDAGLLRHDVLVVVDPGEGDVGLVGAKRWNSEQSHTGNRR